MPKAPSYGFRINDFALPHRTDLPAETLEPDLVRAISVQIAAEFWQPVFGTSLGRLLASRTVVPMPEAPMDEYDFLP